MHHRIVHVPLGATLEGHRYSEPSFCDKFFAFDDIFGDDLPLFTGEESMSIRTLTMAALRVVAVYLAAQSFVYLAQAAAMFATTNPYAPHHSPGLLMVLVVLAPLVAATLVWILAPSLAHVATKGLSATVDAPEVEHMVSAALLVAGVLLFLESLPILVALAMRHASPYGHINVSMVIPPILRCLLGLGLMLFSRPQLVRFLRWLRYAGTGVKRSGPDA